ncbi:hypothetical protein [Qipengyuania sediminis]|uniref:hypothetical protein n=1 Tax=Qipengyuania sediminis TaxID=1532023 RepID=UPI001059A776|nr:hypothetical protein [Qipengyuania sediminis]
MKLAALALAALVLSRPVAAAPHEDLALVRLQQRDGQLFAVGWRLVTANAPFCADAAPALGLSVLDAAAFADPAAVRRQLGLRGDLAIGAIAQGSPAAQAGLRLNDTLLALNADALETRFPRRKPFWQRLVTLTAALDQAAARGPVTLEIASAGAAPRRATLTPVPACPTRFEVLDSGGKALAEGTRVIFGRDFPGFAYPEAEFAAAVAHELAHNLLRHRAALDTAGRSLGNVRVTEREADRLMPWLLANAGYDPQAALSFMQRWGPRHGGGLFRKRTHEGWDERAEAIRAELELVEKALAAEGKADWARHFRRKTLD